MDTILLGRPHVSCFSRTARMPCSSQPYRIPTACPYSPPASVAFVSCRPPRHHSSRLPLLDPTSFFLPRGRPEPPLSPFLFSLLHQGAVERSPRLLSPSCLLSDSEHPTTSPYSPLPRLTIPVHRRLPAIVGLHRITAALPCSGGSHLRACPLLSLNFISWLTSSSFSRCCRSCLRSSTAVVGTPPDRKHPRHQAPPPPHHSAPSVSTRPILHARWPTHTTIVLIVKM
jgi:hypothetical protein